MPTVTFTLASLPSSTAKRLRFEPRDAPWVNTAGAVVTPDGFESSYPRGAVQSITLDTGPWRVRIGLSWYPFDVPAAGGDLAELITWSMPAGAPAGTIAAAVAEFLTANPNGLLTQAAADANYAPVSAALLAAAAAPDTMAVGAITRSASGAATSFAVAWPDGATGTFTGTESTSFPGAIDGYTVTHVAGSPPVTTTYTQPTLTRDASGAVTARPAIVVS